MSVKHAILGLVIERPGDRPDLEQRCRARMPTGGIERLEIDCALAALLREGSIHPTSATDPTRPEPIRVYEATPSGIDQFEAWFNSPPTHHIATREVVLKIGAGGSSGIDRLIALTGEYEVAALERLGQLAEAETFPDAIERIGVWETVLKVIGHDAETAQITSTLEWLSDARDWLKWAKERMPDDQADPSSRGPQS